MLSISTNPASHFLGMLPMLRELHWSSGSGNAADHSHIPWAVLGLPSIQRLLLRRIVTFDASRTTGLERLASGTSNVQHIELRKCRLSQDRLDNIIRVAKSLKTFVYEFSNISLNPMKVGIGHIISSLSVHKASLETLWFDGSQDIWWPGKSLAHCRRFYPYNPQLVKTAC
jgi:hypothetical protein